jgi:hypothetical protein
MAKRKASRKKYYVLKSGRKVSVFTGRQPRQAALKAAARGFTDIRLRERGARNKDRTYSVHVFKGSRAKVSAPANKPSWLPSQVWKPTVKKVGVERLKKLN